MEGHQKKLLLWKKRLKFSCHQQWLYITKGKKEDMALKDEDVPNFLEKGKSVTFIYFCFENSPPAPHVWIFGYLLLKNL